MIRLVSFRKFCAVLALSGSLALPFVGVAVGQTSGTSPQERKTLRTIGFMTDFDVKDDAVGICKAVMNGVAPGVEVIDITHQATPYNIAEGARFLAGSAPYFEKDAVFVVVIDPGVGSTRRAIIARSKKGQFFVLPDNGLLTLVQDRDGIEAVREITNPEWMIGAKMSSTFHGRDIFSPAGAHLARGDDWTTAGPVVDVAKLVRLDIHTAVVNDAGLHGEVIGTDGPFGNLVLNVPAETFAQLGYRLGDTVPVQVGGKTYDLPFVKTFSDVAVGKPLAYIDSRGRLSLGINQRSFAETYGIQAPAEVLIVRKR
ncbi:SAM hydrolase/SAM-dependent halogenase family protein [Tunturiibacter lichenicola]|uniref:SAM hydrolase/SAM-dependent halogenase family protein n=1 Tax=Tunturiibacter lichenicola TaxID=2051959 RepID=UPI0021B25F0D|nr:SAM-dependent chlorinase/fluorinase [Edaphobacter lichenicola]